MKYIKFISYVNIYQSKRAIKTLSHNKNERCLPKKVFAEEIKGIFQCNIFNYPRANLKLKKIFVAKGEQDKGH